MCVGGGGWVRTGAEAMRGASASFTGKTYSCSVRVIVFQLTHESLRATNKSQIKSIMKQQ